MEEIDCERIKRENEALIRVHGGEICDWLPSPDQDTPGRDAQAAARRALVLNAMLQIAFKAPISVIREWIASNGLEGELSSSERAILDKDDGDLTEQERTNLYWYIEALWALAWAAGKVEDLAFNKPVGPELASLMPNLRENERSEAFMSRAKLRPRQELFRMNDLYYRLHWWTRTAQLHGEPSGDVSLDIVMERRKALEWLLNDDGSWDDVELST
ncbi:DUF4272 domain-containing protein [Variovorax paradoxus]|jgi:hypothetical protein|uniref:DUF4272 domain-containing protein n=1 Tax=Variovorax paradoxus TaxID=34073 RepID=UPI0029C94B63|nr:DUF4272 domain-containing protein [Variovorax paradoxus]WPH23472.1 DUF4272 domain-containing protein [Variovorax paradoxus]